jgi:hypothetical protein
MLRRREKTAWLFFGEPDITFELNFLGAGFFIKDNKLSYPHHHIILKVKYFTYEFLLRVICPINNGKLRFEHFR